MQPVPKTPQEALAIFRDPESEEWERDYAALMITDLEEALPDLRALAQDPEASEMLQQRAGGCLANAWRNKEILMTEDVSSLTPAARREIQLHRDAAPLEERP